VSTYKPLGQKATAATTAWDLYTPSVQAAPSTLSICNRGSTQTTFRVAVRPGGATLANDHYIAYDATVDGNDTKFLTIGLTLAAGDVVTVYAGNANLTFNLFGVENP
jgi:hypothetical protein